MNLSEKIRMFYLLYTFSIEIPTSEASKNHSDISFDGKIEHEENRSRSGSLAEKMCKTYTEKGCKLKRSILHHDPEPFSKIVGGKPTQPKQYPHMAAIGYLRETTGKVTWECGGSLISEKFILTAAHCVQSPRPSLIRLGKLDLPNATEDPRKVDYTISKIIVYPDFNSETLLHDIALLEFQRLDTFTDYIRPICLNVLKDIPKQKLTALGWGQTKNDLFSQRLLAVQLDLQSHLICKKEYSDDDYKYDENSVICAGYLSGGKDTCWGDSGGPLQYLKKKAKCSKVPIYTLIGITAFGHDTCGAQSWPGVFTRVSFYIPWIESIVWA